MNNSDLFLELFDDELLKPKECSNNETLVYEKINTADQCDVSSNVIQKKITRTEFDLCSALDKETDVEELHLKEIIEAEKKIGGKGNKSTIHSGDTDSSDDEDNKYMESYNFNEFGRDIKRMLQAEDGEKERPIFKNNEAKLVKEKYIDVENTLSKTQESTSKQLSLPPKTQSKNFDIYADPFFGIRIVNPLISSQGIQLRMNGKLTVPLLKLHTHLAKNMDSDFVTAGVIVRNVTKNSQNDTKYMIWELCDLKEDLLSVSVFLFGRSYKDLWKTQIGTVVAILNPEGNKKGNGNDSFSISVKFPDQVMIWGVSKDYGTCKSLKKNGERCSSFINKNHCEYCIYHVKKEYSKFSSFRSEIQSPAVNIKDINFLRNKVLGKNEVFYGGKSYSALKPPPPSEKAKEKAKKINPKDKQRLSKLGCTVFDNKLEVKSQIVSLPHAPRAALALRTINMDSHILKSLSSPTTNKSNISVKNEIALKRGTAATNSGTVKSNGLDSRISNNIETKSLNDSMSDKKKIPSLTNPEFNSKDKSDSQKLKCKFNSLFNSPTELKISSVNKELSGNSSHKKHCETLVKETNQNKLKRSGSKGNSKASITAKPSLSNPESDDFSININKDVDQRAVDAFKNDKNNIPSSKSERKDKIGKDSRKSLNSKSENSTSKGPSLSDPSGDFIGVCKSSEESKSDKNLQKRFNSLLEVASGQKKKSSLASDSTIQSKISLSTESNNCIKNVSDISGNMDVSFEAKTDSNGKDASMELSSSLNHQKLNTNIIQSSGSSLHTPAVQTFASIKKSRAKARALMFVKQNGPISKADPNAVRKSTENSSRKRDREETEYTKEADGDKGKIVFSQLYLDLMKQTSSQQDLVEAERLRMEEEYFDKMGLKEQLEEKMLNTFKIDCKAVKCLQCKYIWFSAADVCKIERHTLKIVDAFKRFFKCGKCGNRTVSLHILPMFSCKNCQSSSWQRAPMMREKISKINELSIRGGEQQFIHSQASNSNLNLLVPD